MLNRPWRKAWFRVRRDQLDRELAEEIAFHTAERMDQHARAGLPQQAAVEMSHREMGNVMAAKEECRDLWSFRAMEALLQDLRHAARMFAKTPVFTGVAVLSLGLGIGGNTAIYSLVNGLLLRSLPYPTAEALMRVTGIYPRAAVPFFRDRVRSMEIAAVSVGSEVNLTGTGKAMRLRGSKASANFLTVLGVPVARGRGFEAGEELPGKDAVAIISAGLWRGEFGGDVRAIGRVIRVDGVSRRIVGIMPAGFGYPAANIQIWTPMRLDPTNFAEYWGTEFMPLIGRLRPGASVTEARSEIRRGTVEFRGTFPYPMARDWNADSTVIPLREDLVGDVRRKLAILLASVGLVLLIACANVAALLLSRATTRRKEIALRTALGAARGRIFRQLLTESMGLAGIGAVLGVGIGFGALRLFKTAFPPLTPGLEQAGIDWQVLGVVTGLAMGAGLLAGLAPALSASRVELTDAMKTGGQRSTAGVWSRLRGAIIAAEIALTLVLTVSAGLLLRSLEKLSETRTGFDDARVAAVRISPNPQSCEQRAACVAFYNRLVAQAKSVPGVESAAIVNAIPLGGDLPTIPVDVEGHPKTSGRPAPMLWMGAVSAEYFAMLHIPLLAGRFLSAADGADAAPVALISAGTAKHFWPHENAVGRHIKATQSQQWMTIAGVVGDVRQYSLNKALPEWVEGAIYMPYAQAVTEDGRIPAAMTLLVREPWDGAATESAVHRLAQEQDPNVPVGPVQRLGTVAAASIGDVRATAGVFLGFALAALSLAAIGVYGLMSYWVSQRRYEIGLRLAIGARRGRIVSMILAQGMTVTGWGAATGIVAALALTRFLSSLLYGVVATDAETFATVTALVLGVAVAATAIPAWRASRIDPVTSLRVD